jgi:hypothetical protein
MSDEAIPLKFLMGNRAELAQFEDKTKLPCESIIQKIVAAHAVSFDENAADSLLARPEILFSAKDQERLMEVWAIQSKTLTEPDKTDELQQQLASGEERKLLNSILARVARAAVRMARDFRTTPEMRSELIDFCGWALEKQCSGLTPGEANRFLNLLD